MELLAFAGFAILVVAWILAPAYTKRSDPAAE
jgi:cbb3-type cytochrome oxidase subunit 3